MSIDIKFPLPKVSLPKTTGHTALAFQNYRLENKLLQELGKEIDMIISNTVQSKISSFIKFIWKEQYQLEFVNRIVCKSTTVSRLHRYETGTEFLIVLVVTDYHITSILAA